MNEFDMRDLPASVGHHTGEVIKHVVMWVLDNWFKVTITVMGLRFLQIATHFDWNFGALAVIMAHFFRGTAT